MNGVAASHRPTVARVLRPSGRAVRRREAHRGHRDDGLGGHCKVRGVTGLGVPAHATWRREREGLSSCHVVSHAAGRCRACHVTGSARVLCPDTGRGMLGSWAQCTAICSRCRPSGQRATHANSIIVVTRRLGGGGTAGGIPRPGTGGGPPAACATRAEGARQRNDRAPNNQAVPRTGQVTAQPLCQDCAPLRGRRRRLDADSEATGPASTKNPWPCASAKPSQPKTGSAGL